MGAVLLRENNPAVLPVSGEGGVSQMPESRGDAAATLKASHLQAYEK